MSTVIRSRELFGRAKAALCSDLEHYFPGGEKRGVDYFFRRRADDDTPSCHVVPGTNGAVKDFGDDTFRGSVLDVFADLHFAGDIRAAAESINGNGTGVHANATRGPGRPQKVKPRIPIPSEDMPKMTAFAQSKWRLEHYGEAILGSKYEDAESRVISVVVRYERDGKKEIRPFYMGVDGEAHEGQALQYGRPVLHLPEILSNPKDQILVVEGEKKCETAREKLAGQGWKVTTWAGGSGAVERTDWSPLNGHAVTVWPDADEPGLKAAIAIQRRLPHAEVLEIENKSKAWDIADAAAEGLDLAAFIQDCPRIDNDARPQIIANERDLQEISAESILALSRSNDPPDIFLQGGELRLLVEGRLIPIMEYRLRNRLSRAARYVQRSAKGIFTPCAPPLEVVRDIPAWQGLPFPEIERVVHGPTFGATGDLLIEVGYHPEAKLYIDTQVDVQPFNGSGADAVRWLTEELFTDFPFASAADRANAFSALLACFCRSMIPGCIPLYGVEASIHGAGKGLLVDVITHSAFGGCGAELVPYSDQEEEMRKHLTSSLRGAPGALKLDNVRSSIDSTSLSTMLTTMVWSDRVLGKNEIVDLVVRAVTFSTANNPSLSGEMARRYVRIRLTPATETPWNRTGFRHDTLLEWAGQHRGEIIAAVKALVDVWIAAGRPNWSGRPLGSFEAWSRTVGGILEANSIAGFLDNHAELFESADLTGEAWRSLVDAWEKRFGDGPVSAAELFPLAQAIDGLALNGNTEHAQRCSFGRALSSQRDRVFDDRRISRLPGKKNGGKYRLEGEYREYWKYSSRASRARGKYTIYA